MRHKVPNLFQLNCLTIAHSEHLSWVYFSGLCNDSDEFERSRKCYRSIEVLSQHLPERTKEKPPKISARTGGIRAQHFPNTSVEHYSSAKLSGESLSRGAHACLLTSADVPLYAYKIMDTLYSELIVCSILRSKWPRYAALATGLVATLTALTRAVVVYSMLRRQLPLYNLWAGRSWSILCLQDNDHSIFHWTPPSRPRYAALTMAVVFYFMFKR
jgi:hypothetical protein